MNSGLRPAAASVFCMVSLLMAVSVACSVGSVEDLVAAYGKEGVTINALAIDPATPSRLYAGTYFGVFKSTDSGGTWSLADSGLANGEVLALAVDPLAPATLYAAQGAAVFKSADGGA